MRKPSVARTVIAQVSLCFAMYIALNVGRPRKFVFEKRSEGRHPDLCFISVQGGYRSINHQTHLLKLMEKVAKTSKAEFVLTVSELGKDDLFMRNGTHYFSSLRVPWYSVRASTDNEVSYSMLQIELPFGKTLGIIGINTWLLQDSKATSDDTGKGQLTQLRRTLEKTNSDWRIVVGFHPLFLREENAQTAESEQPLDPIRRLFTNYGVNAYLSRWGGTHHIRRGSVAYIGIPGHAPDELRTASSTGKSREETFDGLLLHRVSSLEFVTYHIDTAGEVVHRTLLQQRGREVM